MKYFTSNGSTVSIASLDMVKAFDGIKHYALFLKLMNRQVPVCFIRLLADWYRKMFACGKLGH